MGIAGVQFSASRQNWEKVRDAWGECRQGSLPAGRQEFPAARQFVGQFKKLYNAIRQLLKEPIYREEEMILGQAVIHGNLILSRSVEHDCGHPLGLGAYCPNKINLAKLISAKFEARGAMRALCTQATSNEEVC